MAHYELTDSELRQALTQIPLPAATRHQSIWYLAHIGKIFYCLLEETVKNQPDDTPVAEWEQMSEAFHKSLFDLEILTTAFLEGQYIPAARVMVMAKKMQVPLVAVMFCVLRWLKYTRSTHTSRKSLAMTLSNGFSMNMVLISELKALNFLIFRTSLTSVSLKKPKIDILR